MRVKLRDVVWLAVFGTISGLIIWHVVVWHAEGRYAEMFQDAKAGKTLIPTLYNLGLMITLGLSLGLLMERITRIAGYRVKERKHFRDDGDKKE